MHLIPLSHDVCTIVDDADFDLASKFKWRPHKVGGHIYARGKVDGKSQYLHRTLLNPAQQMVVDHINGNTLDNRRVNLRAATRAENARNCGASKGRPFKGVFPQVGGYMARIVVDRKPIYLGYFKDIEDAARAYDAAAIKEFGEFAWLNFPMATLRA